MAMENDGRTTGQLSSMNIDNSNQHSDNNPTEICTQKDAERAVELLRKLRQQASYHNHKSDPAAIEQLELLERALDSDLFKSVCQVYDQIYDTANISGSSELKAAASAKATVAVFSASIGHNHSRVVELPHTGEGFGFNVMSFDNSYVFISNIKPGGVADKHGGLRISDQLISINGVNIGNDHKKAVKMLKTTDEKLTLVVKYMPGYLEQIEAGYVVKQNQQQQQHQ